MKTQKRYVKLWFIIRDIVGAAFCRPYGVIVLSSVYGVRWFVFVSSPAASILLRNLGGLRAERCPLSTYNQSV